MSERLQPGDPEQENQQDIWEIDHSTIRVVRRGPEREVNGYLSASDLLFCFRVWEGPRAKADPEKIFIHAPYPAIQTVFDGIRPSEDVAYLAEKLELEDVSVEALREKNASLQDTYTKFEEEHKNSDVSRQEFVRKVKETALIALKESN